MKRLWMPLVLLIVGASAVYAQAPELTAAHAALAECLGYADSTAQRSVQKDSARAAAERAEQAFRVAVEADPRSAEAHAGLGEVIARCALPHAGPTALLRSAERAIESLRTALEIEPRHWRARFVLAEVYGSMPAFLNHGGNAIRQLEVLRAQQGGRTDEPRFALTWLRLGNAYARAGRDAEARATYAAGAKLFPAHADLQRAAAATARAQIPATASRSSAGDTLEVFALTPLRVDAGQYQLEEARSTASLSRMDVLMMPGGTAELLQTLQAMPGTTRAGDGADLYVRGGDPEETPIFVDGGRMAFPGRWESFAGTSMGVLDANVLAKAYFSAGAFSAKYGNALSGVVDVESKGRPEEPSWRAGVNLVSVGASAYRPLGAAAGFWSTVLLTDVSVLARMQGQESVYPDVPRSYQAFTGFSFRVLPTLELKADVLASGDEAARLVDAGGYSGTFRTRGHTQHGGLSARWLRTGGRAGVNGSLTVSRREGGYRFGVLARDRTDEAFAARVDGDLISPGGVRVRSGIELAHFTGTAEGREPATPIVAPGAPSIALPGTTAHAAQVGAYVEAEQPLAPNLTAVVGMRADRLPGLAGVSLDPRAALAFTSGVWTLRAAAGVFHQGTWRRRYQLPDGGTPGGVPTRARHLVLGAERTGEPSVHVEAFAKQYDRFAADDGVGPAVAAGVSRGIDAIVRWQQQPKVNGWITYSLLDADLELADGSQAAAWYDVTHSLTVVARYALSDAWELGTTVRYATGKPYTPVLGTQPNEIEGWPDAPVYGPTHGARLPHYARIDGRVTRYQAIGEDMAVFYLEMLDLNGRRNVLGYQYDASYSERRPLVSFFARRTFVLGVELQF